MYWAVIITSDELNNITIFRVNSFNEQTYCNSEVILAYMYMYIAKNLKYKYLLIYSFYPIQFKGFDVELMSACTIMFEGTVEVKHGLLSFITLFNYCVL